MKEIIITTAICAVIGMLVNVNGTKTTKVVRNHTTYVVPASSSIIIND